MHFRSDQAIEELGRISQELPPLVHDVPRCLLIAPRSGNRGACTLDAGPVTVGATAGDQGGSGPLPTECGAAKTCASLTPKQQPISFSPPCSAEPGRWPALTILRVRMLAKMIACVMRKNETKAAGAKA